MALYLVRGDPAFDWLQPAPEPWTWRGGVPVSWEWEEQRLEVSADGAAGEFISVDCLQMLSGADGFVVSDYAREALSRELTQAGELWPVRVVEQRYWWFNCLACLDALDRDKTEADWATVAGDWGSFKWITSTRRLAFRAEALPPGPAVFRVPEYPQGVIFATEAFRRSVEAQALIGFKFDQVWSLEAGGVSDPPGVGLGGVFEDESATQIAGRRARARDRLTERGAGGQQ